MARQGTILRAKSISVEPAEQCPNCRRWYKLGECRHFSYAVVRASKGIIGALTLYGVCSECADAHEQASD